MDFLLHVVLEIVWDVPWSAFHSGCSVSLAAAVPLAAAIIVDGAVYFVLLPPPHAWDLGAPSLNRLAAPSWRCRSALAFVLDLAFALPLGAMATSLNPKGRGML